MYQLHTEKQRLYFNEVIRLHYEEGMGEDRISRILPIGHHEKAKSKAGSPAADRTR